MIVKDAEAPEYECPQAIISDSYVYCRGSRCMAWRWAVQKRLVVDPADDALANEYYVSEPSTTHGYCGLGGRP